MNTISKSIINKLENLSKEEQLILSKELESIAFSCKTPKKYTEKFDQSMNGVRVIVTKLYNESVVTGSVVDADCNCFGHLNRVHTNPSCVLLRK